MWDGENRTSLSVEEKSSSKSDWWDSSLMENKALEKMEEDEIRCG